MEWIERLADLEIEWFEAGALLYCDCGGRVCLVNDTVAECPACHGEYRLIVKVEEAEESLMEVDTVRTTMPDGRVVDAKAVYPDLLYPNNTVNMASWTWQDQTVTAPGYCFDCEERVQVEYYQCWISSVDGESSPMTCLKCGGHEVEFLDRVGQHLLERIEKLEVKLLDTWKYVNT